MSTYRVEDWNEKMQPQRYRTSDGKYFDVKNPSTLINKNSGREVKYGNFIRMYKEEGNNSNILKMAVPNNKSNRNNSNIFKTKRINMLNCYIICYIIYSIVAISSSLIMTIIICNLIC